MGKAKAKAKVTAAMYAYPLAEACKVQQNQMQKLLASVHVMIGNRLAGICVILLYRKRPIFLVVFFLHMKAGTTNSEGLLLVCSCPNIV